MAYKRPHKTRCPLCDLTVIWQRDVDGRMKPFTVASGRPHVVDCAGRRQAAATRGNHHAPKAEALQTTYLDDQESNDRGMGQARG